MTHTVFVVVAVLGVVVYVIGRQLLGEQLRSKRVIVLPLVLTLVGAVDLGKDGRHLHAVDVAFVAANVVLAVGIGLGQGAMMRLADRNGGLWGQMPIKSLWLWAALVAGRLVVSGVADAAHAHVAASSASILLVLGANRLGQAAAIAARAALAGIPFAAENGPVLRPEPPAPQLGSGTTTCTQEIVTAAGAALAQRRRQRARDRRTDRLGRR